MLEQGLSLARSSIEVFKKYLLVHGHAVRVIRDFLKEIVESFYGGFFMRFTILTPFLVVKARTVAHVVTVQLR